MKRFGTEGAAPVAAEEACGESAGDGGVRKRARAAVPPQTVRVYARAHTSRPSRRTFSFARASLAILHAGSQILFVLPAVNMLVLFFHLFRNVSSGSAEEEWHGQHCGRQSIVNCQQATASPAPPHARPDL